MKLKAVKYAVMMTVAILAGSGLAMAAPVAPRPGVVVRSTVSTTDDGDIEVVVRGLTIYVSTSRPIQVKIFTILGQLIVQQNVPAGTTRLSVKARGIYILKAGDATCRITV